MAGSLTKQIFGCLVGWVTVSGLAWGAQDVKPFPQLAVVGPVTTEINERTNELHIVIKKTGDGIMYKDSRKVGPARLIFDLEPAKLHGKEQKLNPNIAGVKRIETSQVSDKVVRVSIEVSNVGAVYSVDKIKEAIVIKFKSETPLVAAKPAQIPSTPKPQIKKTNGGSSVPPVRKPPMEPQVSKVDPPAPPKETQNPGESPLLTPDPPSNVEPPQQTPKITEIVLSPEKIVDPVKPPVESKPDLGEKPDPIPDEPELKVMVMKKGDLDQPVDFFLRGADLLNTLLAIAEETGYNLVPSKSVSGTVTIRLNQVPLRKALELMLGQQGLTYVLDDNIIRVGTADEFRTVEQQGYAVTHTYVLKYAKGSVLSASIQAVLSQKGTIKVDERTNTMIITDTSAKLAVAEEMIRKLDTATKQVEIEAAIVSIRSDKTQELGIRWQLAQGSIADVVPTTGSDVKISSLPTTVGGVGNIQVGAILSPLSIGAFLSMLQRDIDADVLAKPRITTLDNNTAKINIVSEVAYPTASNPTTGVVTFATVSGGIVLEVTPQVNADGRITMKVRPSVSNVISTSPLTVDRRDAETNVIVKDGSTFVLGGLLQENESITTSKFPLLGDVPLVGVLFRSTTKTKVKNELVIFITPRILPED